MIIGTAINDITVFIQIQYQVYISYKYILTQHWYKPFAAFYLGIYLH